MAIPQLAMAIAGISGASWVGQNVVGVGEWLTNYFDPKVIAPRAQPVNNSFANFAMNLYHFKIQVLAPTNEDIKGLDDFFEAYGYRVDRFMKPNLLLRSNFTYVKTKDAKIKSSNFNAMQQLKAMLDNGCKFWRV